MLSYIRSMGECRSDKCDRITINETWAWVLDYNVWLSVAYLPDKQKVVADKLSREFNMIAGWQFHLTILEKMSAAFNTPSIDLFARNIIGRLRIYVSCPSDPDILLTDAFIINWDQFPHNYCVVACFRPTGKKF